MVELMHDILLEEVMNKNRKLAFVKECYRGSEASHLSLFNTLSNCEDYFGKDICEISKEDILPFVRTAVGKSSSAISTNLSTLNKYYKYCLEHNFHGALPVYISYSEVSSLRDLRWNMVSSPGMLEEVLNCIFPSVEEGEYSNVLRCLLWMLYSGVQIEEANEVRTGDVHLADMYFISNGGKYPIYSEARDVFDFCLNSNVIAVKMPKGKWYRERVDGDLLLRSFTILTPVKLRNGVVKHVKSSRISGRCAVELTCQSVYKSGLFYRAYIRDNKSLAIDVSPFDNSTKAPKLKENASLFYHNRSLKRDYESWKATFYK